MEPWFDTPVKQTPSPQSVRTRWRTPTAVTSPFARSENFPLLPSCLTKLKAVAASDVVWV